MKYRNLGHSGLQVSAIGVGCMSFGDNRTGTSHAAWAVDEEEAERIVKTALDAGVNFFDTANAYSSGTSEVITGRLLGELARRDDIVLATKVFQPMRKSLTAGGLSRKEIMREIDQSLARLGTEYVDLYQIHRWDDGTPIEETMEALHDVVKAGKTRYIGASSMYAWQFAKAQYAADLGGWTRFVSMQNHYNLLHRFEELEMIPQCQDRASASSRTALWRAESSPGTGTRPHAALRSIPPWPDTTRTAGGLSASWRRLPPSEGCLVHRWRWHGSSRSPG